MHMHFARKLFVSYDLSVHLPRYYFRLHTLNYTVHTWTTADEHVTLDAVHILSPGHGVV